MNDSLTPDTSLLADDFRIAPDCIDIWVVPIQTTRQVIEDLQQTLSSDELERALRFHAEEHRHMFVTARGILRTLLCCYVPEHPRNLGFGYSTKGKPYLQSHAVLHFNVGHSGGRAVYAVGGDDVGVDIELIKPLQDWQNISARFFSPKEVEELKSLDPPQQVAGFFACWARKEAYIKATGAGLATGLDKFYACANPSHTEGSIKNSDLRQWYFKDLDLGSEYAGAVVTRFSQCRIRTFNFQRTEDCLRFVERKRISR